MFRSWPQAGTWRTCRLKTAPASSSNFCFKSYISKLSLDFWTHLLITLCQLTFKSFLRWFSCTFLALAAPNVSCVSDCCPICCSCTTSVCVCEVPRWRMSFVNTETQLRKMPATGYFLGKGRFKSSVCYMLKTVVGHRSTMLSNSRRVAFLC